MEAVILVLRPPAGAGGDHTLQTCPDLCQRQRGAYPLPHHNRMADIPTTVGINHLLNQIGPHEPAVVGYGIVIGGHIHRRHLDGVAMGDAVVIHIAACQRGHPWLFRTAHLQHQVAVQTHLMYLVEELVQRAVSRLCRLIKSVVVGKLKGPFQRADPLFAMHHVTGIYLFGIQRRYQ